MELGSIGRGLRIEDLSCPICMESLKDPFVTTCGHSFCYSCITMHLQNKNVCPCCSEYLTTDKVFPNYTLSKASIPLFIPCSYLALDLEELT